MYDTKSPVNRNLAPVHRTSTVLTIEGVADTTILQKCRKRRYFQHPDVTNYEDFGDWDDVEEWTYTAKAKRDDLSICWLSLPTACKQAKQCFYTVRHWKDKCFILIGVHQHG